MLGAKVAVRHATQEYLVGTKEACRSKVKCLHMDSSGIYRSGALLSTLKFAHTTITPHFPWQDGTAAQVNGKLAEAVMFRMSN